MKLKKILSTVLASFIFLGAVACGNGSNENDKQDGSKEGNVDKNVSGEENNDNDKEPDKISIFVPSRLPEAIYNDETMVYKELEKRLNIDLEIQSVVHSEAGEKILTMMTSGEYPDIVATSLNNINTYGVQGAFEPLNDYLSADKTPNIQKYLIDNDEALAQATASDGKVYGVPMLSAIRTAMGYMVREDWLKKIDMEVPVTIDDWYEMLTKFKNTDLNGNGAGDVTPLILDRAWENYYYNFADAWGIELNPNNDYWLTRNGKVEYAPLLPETKEFIGTMAKWYSEGLIDKDFVTREDTNNYHIYNNKAGATVYWTGYVVALNYDDNVLKNDPDTRWKVVNPPVLKEGQEPKTYSQQSVIVPYSWGMSTAAENKDAIIKLFEYVYSDEGSMLLNFGLEGESYEMVDGKPKYTEMVMNHEGGSTQYLRTHGMQSLIGMRQLPEYEEASTLNQDVRDQFFTYDDNNLFYDFNPSIPRTEEEQDKYETKMSAISTYVDEELMNFVIGNKSMDEFDAFVESVKSLGIDEIIEVMQGAYDRYSSVGK